MQYEVEQKHRVDKPGSLVVRLAARGAALSPIVVQSDQYFAHPCRDFATTDEALRIRTVGDANFVTYKGPKLDAATKTRREIELRLDPDDESGELFTELLTALGFVPVAVVRKERRKFQLEYDGFAVEGALDSVDGLGTFVEFELQADEVGLDDARRVIAALAEELNLGPSERRSYLELLLERDRRSVEC